MFSYFTSISWFTYLLYVCIHIFTYFYVVCLNIQCIYFFSNDYIYIWIFIQALKTAVIEIIYLCTVYVYMSQDFCYIN